MTHRVQVTPTVGTTPRAAPAAPGAPDDHGGLAEAVYLLGGVAGALSRLSRSGGGGTLPGRVVLRLLPDAATRLSHARRLLLVSGTNGKTTTTRMLASALAGLGPVLSNSDGANQASGLVSTLMRGRRRPTDPAVLEVDEIALPAAVVQLVPSVVVLLNLSRDQLDRTGEVAAHVDRWQAALRQAPTTVVVANADDPLVTAAVLGARPDSDQVVWVGAGQPWRADAVLCPVCGAPWAAATAAYSCGVCGFTRPETAWGTSGGDVLAPGPLSLPADLRLPGRANVANAAMAAAAAACLGVDPREALPRMRSVTDVEGRYRQASHNGCEVRLLLAKNPAGWAEVLAQLADRRTPVVLAVNARSADGLDPSWLWDVPFEQLQGRTVVAAGERAADLSVRLLYAGVAHTTTADALDGIDPGQGRSWDVAANYTAFTRVRDRLRGAAAEQPA